MRESRWRSMSIMDLNLTSTFLMVKAALLHMKSGAIVNIASQAGRDGGGTALSAHRHAPSRSSANSANGTTLPLHGS